MNLTKFLIISHFAFLLSASERKLSQEQLAEIGSEIFRITWNTDRDDRSRDKEAIAAILSLQSGAAFEGVIRGFIYSERYRKLENCLAPTDFSSKQRDFLKSLLSFLKLSENDLFPRQRITPLVSSRPGSGSLSRTNIAILKRVLSERLMEIVPTLESRETLASWYSAWTEKARFPGVDNGLSARNISDPEFHRKWALTASRELILWESLNRVFRSLNSFVSGTSDTCALEN